MSCGQTCSYGEYRALCQQSGIESVHCEQSCTKLADLKLHSSWTGIYITQTAQAFRQPIPFNPRTLETPWWDFHVNTSTQVSRNIRSALLPISVHKFIDADFGEFGGAVSISLEKSCSCALCDIGTFKDRVGQTTCVPCRPGNYSDVRGLIACRLCAAGKFSREAGASACQDCPIWGTSQPGQSFCTLRPPPPEQPFVVEVSLGSPMAPNEFTIAVEGSFRAAIAAAAGVDVMACQITSIFAARRAPGSTVIMEIGAADLQAASNIANGLSADKINAEMSKAGLPGLRVLGMRVTANEKFINTTAPSVTGNYTSFWSQQVGPAQMWVWIAAGGGVVFICCCGCVSLVCLRRKKAVDEAPEGDKTAIDVVVDESKLGEMKGESKLKKLEGESTLTGDVVFEKGERSAQEDASAKEKEEPKCKYCGKQECNPKMDGFIKLQGLKQLQNLNDKEGRVIKIFKKQKHCAVQLEAGPVVTVQFKNIKCAEPKEMPSLPEGETNNMEGDGADAGADARGGAAPEARAAPREAGHDSSDALDPENGDGAADCVDNIVAGDA